ncbi:2-iminobutanoate/2-iminopropanoate deaminase [bioreactor metagenome]|uniref:2-iminobutanoate/2-iminopropanoate deaminase n=1 Tax=bioreactor metagenome TaxID=1076179 RepID=A0A645FTT1_9ZZZZ
MISKIETPNAPKAIGPYSQAIVHNGLVYTSGQIPIDPSTGNVESCNIEVQTHRVLKNLTEVLKAAGASTESVIKTTCFLKNMSDFSAFNAVYETVFTEKPARSCVAVKELPKDVLVEIEVTAAVI